MRVVELFLTLSDTTRYYLTHLELYWIEVNASTHDQRVDCDISVLGVYTYVSLKKLAVDLVTLLDGLLDHLFGQSDGICVI